MIMQQQKRKLPERR